MKSLAFIITAISIFLILPLPAFAQWLPPMQLTDTICFTDSRAVAVGETLHVVGEDPFQFFYYIRSSDNGMTWSELEDPIPRYSHGYFPDIIFSNGKLHLCWIGPGGTGYQQVYHMSSSDGGRTWGSRHQVFNNGSSMLKYSRLTAKGDTLFLCCYDDRLLIFRSYDAGVTWSNAYVVEDGPINIECWPNILFTQNRLHLIYEMVNVRDTVSYEIFHRYSDNKGLTWSAREFLSTPEGVPNYHASQTPSAAADSAGHIMALWFDYKYGSACGFTGDILGRVSTDNGISWLPECRLTNTQTGQISSCVIANGYLYAIWNDARWFGCDAYKLYYSSSSDWGQIWTEPYMISDDVRIGERFPAFAITQRIDSTYLHTFFDRNDSSTNDLYYIQGQEELTGINWTKPVLPETFSLSAYPNPFNSSVMLTINKLKGGELEITIYDIQGRVVNSFSMGDLGGDEKIVWDACDASGKKVSSGIYFARARNENNEKTIKLLYLK